MPKPAETGHGNKLEIKNRLVLSPSFESFQIALNAHTKTTKERSYEPKDYSYNDIYQATIPFEFHAFEAILTTVNTLYSQEYKTVSQESIRILAYFNSTSAVIVPYSIQEKMRNLKNQVSQLATKLQSFKRVLSVLIDDDESMALMNLSILKENPSLYRCVGRLMFAFCLVTFASYYCLLFYYYHTIQYRMINTCYHSGWNSHFILTIYTQMKYSCCRLPF